MDLLEKCTKGVWGINAFSNRGTSIELDRENIISATQGVGRLERGDVESGLKMKSRKLTSRISEVWGEGRGGHVGLLDSMCEANLLARSTVHACGITNAFASKEVD